jgi:L-alanine-DL-glutamate epimerase-like enolase superfamily enzyme
VAIERLEVVPYALPFKEPYVTARGRLERRELVLVRIHAEGLAGLGEAVPLALRGGDSLAGIVADLERNGVLLADAEVDPAFWARPTALLLAGTSTQAAAAIEIALLDLAGKVAGDPAWRLLGAPDARPLRCNATLTAGKPEEVARQGLAWAERGFDTFKLKVGMAGDVEQVLATRDAVGPGARLRVDANGSWTVEDAARQLAAMGPLELAEEPVVGLEAMARLRNDGHLPPANDGETQLPLVADESVTSLADAERADDLGACDFATVKIAKVGGPIAALAVARALRVYLSSALDGPVGIAAAAHVAQALPDLGIAHGLATARLFAETVGRGAELDGFLLHVSDAPGLGVELDEDALARLAI